MHRGKLFNVARAFRCLNDLPIVWQIQMLATSAQSRACEGAQRLDSQAAALVTTKHP